MAHFAKVNVKNVVEQVIVVPDEHENRGQDFINNTLKLPGRWIQTSYNATFGGKFAGIGDLYYPQLNEFRERCPFSGWVWVDNLRRWQPPFEPPADGNFYDWSESEENWVVSNSGLKRDS